MIMNESFKRGVKAIIPLILGLIPFALISGITASNAGLSLGMTMLMSIGIFAGASQLAVLQLALDNANTIVIIYTALIINLRMMIYSLSISQHLRKISVRWKAILAYTMTDQSYAISMVHFLNEPNEDKKSFIFGASISIWTLWQINTIIGYLMGSIIPQSLGLEFAIPLTFIAVLLKGITGWPGIITIITSGSVAVLAASLPMNLGLIIAAIVGIAVGTISEKLMSKAKGNI